MSTKYITTRKALETGLAAVLTHSDQFMANLDALGPQAMAERVAKSLTCHLSVHSDTTRRGEPEIDWTPPAPAAPPAPQQPAFDFFAPR